MGRRSATKTVIEIFQAFAESSVWRQAELAARVGVSVEALRRALLELQETGMHLERQEDGGQVYWSVARTWHPGGVSLPRDSAISLLRELVRLRATPTRRRLVAQLLAAVPRGVPVPGDDAFLPPPSTSNPGSTATDEDTGYLTLVEDSKARGEPLYMHYLSISSGEAAWRHVSVQAVAPEAPARFIAFCHRHQELRWFRVDGIVGARLDPTTPFRAIPRETLREFARESIDGFHEPESPATHEFTVRDPEARWVSRNLLPPMRYRRTPDGIHVSATTAGTLRIARYVLSLGGAARPLTDPLRALVQSLAEEALTESQRTTAPPRTAPTRTRLNDGAVTSIRRRG